MAKADARGAPEADIFVRRTGRRRPMRGLSGNARIIAAPAYERLIAAEPYLRRSIPTLIIVFLVIVAAARATSLMSWREDIERSARMMLGLGAAQIASAIEASHHDPQPHGVSQVFLERSAPLAALRNQHALLITDGRFQVVAATPELLSWTGKSLEELISAGQPLFLFGERAGVMAVTIGGEPWLATVRLLDDNRGATAALLPRDRMLAEWRRAVSLNVTLFVITSGVLIVVLYAYFSQAARAQAADRIYNEAHQRIDLALVRGRCGLWDWDMGRGKMYWSRSMYDMLGYEPCEDMLSFGDVAGIIHADDGDLFGLANRIVSREIDQIDQIFRMRHAKGHWVWMRARAQVIDPDSSEVHLIGIAVDVTEQHNLARQSEQADMRLRTAIESISESFVLWDLNDRLV
ncbi:MAG: PAS domain-containing protein, partial [Nitratireductor sp.]